MTPCEFSVGNKMVKGEPEGEKTKEKEEERIPQKRTTEQKENDTTRKPKRKRKTAQEKQHEKTEKEKRKTAREAESAKKKKLKTEEKETRKKAREEASAQKKKSKEDKRKEKEAALQTKDIWSKTGGKFDLDELLKKSDFQHVDEKVKNKIEAGDTKIYASESLTNMLLHLAWKGLVAQEKIKIERCKSKKTGRSLENCPENARIRFRKSLDRPETWVDGLKKYLGIVVAEMTTYMQDLTTLARSPPGGPAIAPA